MQYFCTHEIFKAYAKKLQVSYPNKGTKYPRRKVELKRTKAFSNCIDNPSRTYYLTTQCFFRQWLLIPCVLVCLSFCWQFFLLSRPRRNSAKMFPLVMLLHVSIIRAFLSINCFIRPYSRCVIASRCLRVLLGEEVGIPWCIPIR